MPTPLYTRGPSLYNSFTSKWSDAAPALQGILDPGELELLIRMDEDRVSGGQFPLSSEDTARAILAMRNKNRITQTPRKKFLGNTFLGSAVQDLGDIAAGVVKLPVTLAHEAQDIVDPEAWGEAENIAQLPGVRMVPGAFVANALLSGEPGQLAEHPLMTALDILPYANKLSKLTLDKPLLQATKEASHVTVGELVRKTTGRYPFATAKEGIGETGVGPWIEQMGFGKRRRSAARGSSEANRQLRLDWQERYNKRADELFPDMDIKEIEELTRIGTEQPELIPSLPPHQQAILQQVRGMTEEIAQSFYDEGKLFPINGEWYDVETAKKMLNLQKQIEEGGAASQEVIDQKYTKFFDAQRIVDAKETVEGTRTPDLHRFVDDFVDNIHRPQQANALFHALEEGGHVDKPIVELYRQVRATKKGDEMLRESIKDDLRLKLHQAIDNPPENPLWGWDNTTDALLKLQEDLVSLQDDATGPLLRSLTAAHRNLVEGKIFQAVRSTRAAARRMMRDPTTNELGQYLNEQAYALERYHRSGKLATAADKARDDVRKLTADITNREARQAKVGEELPKMEARNPPARFLPMLANVVKERVKTVAITRGADPAQITPLIEDQLYTQIPQISVDEVNRISDDVAKQWVDLRDAGFDPIYLHAVSPDQVSSTYHASIMPDVQRSPTAVRKRSLDAKPYVKNFAVGLKHEGLEYLRMKGSREFQEQMEKTYGITLDQLQKDFLPAATKLAASRGTQPVLVLDELINNEYAKWIPQQVFPWPTGRSTALAEGSELYLPKTIQSVLRTMYTETQHPMLQGAWDVGTQAFRISVLALSPRWHVYNVLGGGVMTMAETGFIPFVRHAKDAWEMTLRGKLPNEISSGLVSMPEDAMYGYLAGKTLGRLAHTIWGERGVNIAHKVGQALNKPIKASFRFNELVDNFYRSTAYLSGKSKNGHAYGIELANKVLQDWDSMVPIERTIVRNVFPFYGWMRHILGYTFRYPFDHPVRAAIMSNFARNELEDEGTGLPRTFSQMFTLGQPDHLGRVKAINMRGANPFADVANYFTLAGFLSQLNPVFGSFFQAAGINEITGHAELYPDLQYDPNTGQLVPQTPSLPTAIVGNIIPQAAIPLSLIGLGPDDMKVMRKDDPERFHQMLWTAAGLPFFPKTINRKERRALEELKRSDTQKAALSRALKTGNWQDAWQYPGLRPILKKYQSVLDWGRYKTPPS